MLVFQVINPVVQVVQEELMMNLEGLFNFDPPFSWKEWRSHCMTKDLLADKKEKEEGIHELDN